MYRIMLLDDEANIVDGLYVLLQNQFDEQVDLYPCYSSDNALEILRYRPIDILVLDIKMPGHNGMEILEWLSRNRPSCRAILLSGYSDFQYVQMAMHYQCCVGYVLKTQDDACLLEEIRHQMMEIDAWRERHTAILRVQKRLYALDPNLHDSAVRAWLFDARFARTYGIPELRVDLSRPMLPVLMRFDAQIDMPMVEALQCVDEVMQEVITALPLREYMKLENSVALWILQDTPGSDPIMRLSEYIKLALQYVGERIDSLELAAVFISSGSMCSHEELAQSVNCLKTALQEGNAFTSNVLIQETGSTKDEMEAFWARLHGSLDSGSREELAAVLDSPEFQTITMQVQDRIHIAAAMLDTVLSWSQNDSELYEVSLQVAACIAQVCTHNRNGLQEMAQLICDARARQLARNGDRLVQFVSNYIDSHLQDSDLSLTNIAMATMYNPVYLSRVVKQKLGKGVLEIINDRRYELARQMLLEGQLSVQEITRRVGFQSPSYFSFFFRKKSGMSPTRFLREHVNR